MPRSGEAARRRLREAALDLYGAAGYDSVTTGQIAAHAGVTERTFFRHFADKREVLFDGEQELTATMVEAIAAAPDGLSPLQLVLHAYLAALPLFVSGRAVAQRRETIISSSPALQERALAKAAGLVEAHSAAVQARGVDTQSAQIVAQVGLVVFTAASRDWDGRSPTDLRARIAAVAADLPHLM